jgi:hypothetical protein
MPGEGDEGKTLFHPYPHAGDTVVGHETIISMLRRKRFRFSIISKVLTCHTQRREAKLEDTEVTIMAVFA